MLEARLLIRLGVLLLLLGLLTGVVIPSLAVPRLALSSHILGILGGLRLDRLRARLASTPARASGIRGSELGWLSTPSTRAG